MTVYAITDTKKGRTGIAPTYLQTTPGLLSPISYAVQRGILLRRENPTYGFWAAATHGFKMVLRLTAAVRRGFTIVLFTASRRNNFVRGNICLSNDNDWKDNEWINEWMNNK